ncbi:MAG: mannose-1-phosphate guanylyltransferase, partial [Oligoflexia bacterium]|nr:mannose-1-phosphate guanylyltransferase [Oligoflexia bacterium]
PLLGDKSLLVQTIERVKPVFRNSSIHVVVGRPISDKVSSATASFKGINIIVEPAGRNTAPCIGYMAHRIASYHGERDVMVVLPSDHHIADNRAFLDVLSLGIETSKKTDSVIALGIKPSFPHTGYGYIQKGEELFKAGSGLAVNRIESFREKPDIETARNFISDGNYLWNAGIYIMKVSVIIEAIKKHMPELHGLLLEISAAFGKKNEDVVFKKIFPRLPSESIDFGVIEKLDNSLTIPSEFGWNDLGSWTSLEDVHEKRPYGISNTENIADIDSQGLIINSGNKDKLLAVLNVKDLIIIDTDDVLLVASKDDAQRVKDIVNRLKGTGFEKYL